MLWRWPKNSDVLVDFSSPQRARGQSRRGDGGGHSDRRRHHRARGTPPLALRRRGEKTAVLQTGNTSLGVTLLAHLVREAAQRLGEDWDIEIVETHHRMKVDAPSGTALLLGEAAPRAAASRLRQ
jgi:4-hydroxy-tetrahydrodipicolinate reductase